MAIRRELGNRLGEGDVLNNIGIIYYDQGNYERALEYYRKDLAIRQAAQDSAREGIIFNNIAAVYQGQGRDQQALEYYQKSLAIHQTLGNRRREGQGLINIGGMFHQQGRYRQALDFYQKSLAIHQAIGDRQGESLCLHLAGNLYALMGEYARGIEHIRRALAIARAINSPDDEWRCLADLAWALERSGARASDEALDHYRSAVAVIKKLRGQWQRPEQRAGFLQDKIWVYERLCNALAHRHQTLTHAGKGYDREAFQYAEEARARALVELLEESRIALPIVEGPGADLLERERTLQAALSRAQIALRNATTGPQRSELEKQRDTLYHEYEGLIDNLRRRNPRYAQLKYPDPISLKECQRLLDEETVLLEYLLGEEGSLLFAVSKESYKVISLSGRKSIEERAHKLRKTFTLDGTVNGNLQLRYVAEAAALYDALIKPAEKMLTGKKRILVAPDGVLYHVPFPALLTRAVSIAGTVDFKRLPYLVRQYGISYVPSASALKWLLESKNEKPAPARKFLAFADPVYELRSVAVPAASAGAAADAPASDGDTRGQRWKRLPYSGEEARRIAELYPADMVRLFLREQATEENVKKADLSAYARIHFAAHSLALESQPQFSGIILTAEAGSGEDGHLQMYEIFNLRLNAQLVVLSGCETGLRKLLRGEGMMGLVRAFLYAGAERVMASLWSIEDRSTSDLMRNFYAALEAHPPALALRSAQLQFIEHGRYSHPYFWSAFSIYGAP